MVEVRPDGDELADEVGAPKGDVEADVAAVAPPDEIDRTVGDRFDERDRVGGHQLVAHVADIGGVAVTPLLREQQPTTGAQRLDLHRPGVGGAHAAVEQHGGRAVASALLVEPHLHRPEIHV